MGCAITSLLEGKEIAIEDLSGKIVAVDTLNILFQFVTTIRQRDGSPLMDSHGQITSHLIGLFNRTTSLMGKGLKLVFVFDGKAPVLKDKERARRRELKKEARLKYEEAKEKGDFAEMKKHSSRMDTVNRDMINEAKELLVALGLPVVQAPSEGEAQASFMVSKGDAYCVASQDADSLLFGGEKVVKNLSIAGRRKKANKFSYNIVKPELINLSDTLNALGITREQLVVLGILIGTDYNQGGVKGLGPKKGLAKVKEYGEDFEKLFASVEWDFEFSWKEVYDTIIDMPMEENYVLEWKNVDEDGVFRVLCEKHDFSRVTVEKKLKGFMKNKEKKKQKSLDKWF
jgi:flap endonuclease-1